jgi:hypothetical protein
VELSLILAQLPPDARFVPMNIVRGAVARVLTMPRNQLIEGLAPSEYDAYIRATEWLKSEQDKAAQLALF